MRHGRLSRSSATLRKRGTLRKLSSIIKLAVIFVLSAQLCAMYFISYYPISNGNSPDIFRKEISNMRKSNIVRHLHNQEHHHRHSKCPTDLDSTSLATTLVTQTTLDRLPLLKETCQRWSSPIIAVVYLTPLERSNSWKEVVKTYSGFCAHMTLIPYQAADDMEKVNAYPINKMRNVGLDEVKTSHLLLIDADFIPSVGLDDGVQQAVQAAREISLNMEAEEPEESERTAEVGVAEGMNESKEMDETEEKQKTEGSRSSRGDDSYHHFALVVPAYERTLDSSPCENLEDCLKLTAHNPEFMPRSMESLSKCVHVDNSTDTNSGEGNSTITNYADNEDDLNHSKCLVFHSAHFKKGHGDTKSEEWLKLMDTENIRSIPCISDGYEPYVVIPWCPSEQINHGKKSEEHRIEINAPLSPYYDERFYGYGKNKIQQIHHLRSRGYQFAVIPALGFLTHHPHPKSKNKLIWEGTGKKGVKTDLRQKMDNMLEKYASELKSMYEGKVKEATKFCPKKKRKKPRPKNYTILYLSMGFLVLLTGYGLRRKSTVRNPRSRL